MKTKRGFIILMTMLPLWGCESVRITSAPVTRPSPDAVQLTAGSPRGLEATPGYWYDKPALSSVTSLDFQKLWDACADVSHFDSFMIDRQDYRLGLMTTRPMVSKQFFEFWRSDACTVYDIAQSSLQTIRRTIRWEFDRTQDGDYVVRPKVLVERLWESSQRLTSVSEYRSLYVVPYKYSKPQTLEGLALGRYWYAIGRDPAMEKQLANAVRERVAQSQ
jgi:hypothetical protein